MLNKLICPDCKGKLIKKNDSISCNECKRKFKIVNGIPVILPKKLSNFKKIEINFYEKEFGKEKNEFGFVESDWDKNTFGLLNFMEFFEKLPKDSKILEVGAGNGQFSLILHKKGFKNVVTSDISVEGLIAAKEYSKKKKMLQNNSFFVFDAENIPFETNTFDIIFLTASLHHLQEPQRGIAEMNRCVKQNGLIIIAIEPNTWYYYIIRPSARLLKIRGVDRSKDSFSIGDESTQGFSLRRLKRYFNENDIKIIKTHRVWYITGMVYYFPDLMKRIFNIGIPINPKIRTATLKIDKFIEKIPLISSFSFHNTIIGMKK